MKPAPVWPTWPFTRLTPREMAVAEHERNTIEDAPP